MDISRFISPDKQRDTTAALRRQDNPVSVEAARVIDELVDVLSHDLHVLTDLQVAVKRFLKAEAVVHRSYPNTATCRSAPGKVAGQAFTRHCAATCSNPDHMEAKSEYADAYSKLIKILEVIDE